MFISCSWMVGTVFNMAVFLHPYAEHHRVVCRESAEGSTFFLLQVRAKRGEWGNDPMHSYFHAHPSIAHSLPLAPVSFSFVVVFPWFFPISPSFSVFFHGLSRFSMVSLGFPWCFHGFSMVFPWFSPFLTQVFQGFYCQLFPEISAARRSAAAGRARRPRWWEPGVWI